MDKQTMAKIMKELKQAVLRYCPNTEKIILYGSYARGDNTEESDMDILVVVNDSRQNVCRYRDIISEISSDLGLKYDILLSILVRDTNYFQEGTKYIPFYQNIAKEGIKWYDRAA